MLAKVELKKLRFRIALIKLVYLGEHFDDKFQTVVKYEGKPHEDGRVAYDFPSKLHVKYMLHCNGGYPTFRDGVILSNLTQMELVLFET
jgi:hypothetical protein